jgi:hypothetical protein
VGSLLRRWLITFFNEVLPFKPSRKYAASLPTALLSLILHWTNGWFYVSCSHVKLKFRQKIRLVSAPLILVNVIHAAGRGVALLLPHSATSALHTHTHTHTHAAYCLFFDDGRECGEIFPTLLIYFWTWT